jgi:hypothetical protein
VPGGQPPSYRTDPRRQELISRRHPRSKSFGSYVSFNDSDGNNWVVQEVTTRIPSRTTSVLAAYGSVGALADALRRAAAAHDRHTKDIGHDDPDWPDWYAQYPADESAART